jgi:hypothetical protein
MICYGVFIALFPLGEFTPIRVGKVNDLLKMSCYIWPYLLLLPFEERLGNSWNAGWIAADVVGAVIVWLFLRSLQRLFAQLNNAASWAVAIVFSVIPLCLIDLLVLLVAVSLGIRVGE